MAKEKAGKGTDSTAKGKMPAYNGIITNENREQVGKAALWNNGNPKGEKSPAMTGIVEINGAKYRVAFWKSENGESAE